MGGLDTVATVVGGLGNAAAAILFLSPIPTYKRIIVEKTTRDFSALTYVITWLNCVLWVLYGQRKGVVLIMTINGFGIVIQTLYITIFLIYASKPKERRKVTYLWAAELLFAVAVGVGIRKGIHSKNIQITVFGVLCDVLNAMFCWAPLSVVSTVVKTKSVEFMPLPLTLMTLVNCICWVAYGAMKKNYYVIIPNVLGLIGGIIQTAVYFWYWKTPESIEAAKKTKTKVPGTPHDQPSDIELQKQGGSNL